MSIILAAGAARMKLEAENYEARISELEAHIAALEAQLAEARKALEPFALVAKHDISEDEADSDPFRPMPKPFSHAPQITVGHLRAARRALAAGFRIVGPGEVDPVTEAMVQAAWVRASEMSAGTTMANKSALREVLKAALTAAQEAGR